MDRALSRNVMAGASFLVQMGGETLIQLQKGYADLETRRPVREDSLFHLYSLTKPIVAAAAMILMERGMLDLSAPVSRYLGGFKNQRVIVPGGGTVPAKREVTIRDLLSMTSGLPYGDRPDRAGKAAAEVFEEIDRRLYGSHPMTTLEIADRLGQCPLSFQPGERWMYGTSADILGAVIERISGYSLAQFLREEIFKPLDMADTGFDIPKEKQHRFVKSYLPEESGSLKEHETNFLGVRYCTAGIPAFQSGGAGLISTMGDYARFASMLNNEGSLEGRRILLPQTVRFMLQPSLLPCQREIFNLEQNQLGGYSYGSLMRILLDPGMAVFNSVRGEYGWSGWIGNLFANVPGYRLTLLYMMQKPGAGTSETARELFNVSYAYCLSGGFPGADH